MRPIAGCRKCGVTTPQPSSATIRNARTNLALELGVLAGPDETPEGVGYKLALPPPRHQDLKSFRVLVVDSHPLCPTAASVQGALDHLADRLAGAGAHVSRTSGLLPDPAKTARLHVELNAAFTGADLPADAYPRIEGAAKALPPDADDLGAVWLRGVAVTHRDWVRATWRQIGLRQQVAELLKSFDVVLCPPMPTPAFPHDHSNQRTRQLDIDGKRVPYLEQIVWASLATVAGLPATVAPIGHSEEGLPIGVQIVGPYLEDRTTIAFAGLIEREFGGFVPPPAH